MSLAAILVVAAAASSTAIGSASAEDPPAAVLMAAGDIACDPASSNFRDGAGVATSCRMRYTSDLVVAAQPDAVAVLGDAGYKCASLATMETSYHPTWGRFRDITRPAVGNHEYQVQAPDPQTGCDASNEGARGYFTYFGASAGDPTKGYYSYDLGPWHVVVLNSNCTRVDQGLPYAGCSVASPQVQWLKSDLAATTQSCILAYWHHPLFATGTSGSPFTRPFWDALYAAGADVVLNGHEHWYERRPPVDPSGAADRLHGIRQFIVGTGGVGLYQPSAAPAPGVELNNSTFGVLKLTLRSGGYDWAFVPEAGKSYADAGSGECDPTPDTTPPSVPAQLTADAPSPIRVSLTWTASADDDVVAGYRIVRDGVEIATSPTPAYTDDSVVAGTTYQYAVSAYDRAGNDSEPSASVTVTTPEAPSTQVLEIPVAYDAHVNKSRPAVNTGGATPMFVDGSPQTWSLLHFDVSGVAGRTIQSAKLVVHVPNGSPGGGTISRTDGRAWTELGVTWDTRPLAAGTPVAFSGPVTNGRREFDVGALARGDGVLDLVVRTTHGDDIQLASKQAAITARRPKLVLTVQ